MLGEKSRRKNAGRTGDNLIISLAILIVLTVAVMTVLICIRGGSGGADTDVTLDQQISQSQQTTQSPQETTVPTQPTTVPPTTEQTQPPTTEPTQPPTTEPETEPTTAPTDPETEPTESPTEPETEPEPTYPDVTPDYGDYIDVGYGYIAEVITYSAETFNGKTKDDYSAPTRNYLPEGTLDYASTKVVSNSSASYMLLRCGRRVYVDKSNSPSSKRVPVVECYYGTLPDHNEVGFSSMSQQDHFTILTLDVMWKAPFYVDIKPQKYINASARDYRVKAFTAEYIDITFCYATSFEGTVEIDGDNPLFSSAKLTQNESDCTLRLYLKEKGGFYGYDTYYNEDDQLCFKFLNPVSASETDTNSYGADLTGVRIMIDVGHGGYDCGALATDKDGKQVTEAELNLDLAKILRDEMESMGATVILNRTDDSLIRTDDRIKDLKEVAPDICISIHQNSYAKSDDVHGVKVCYSTPFSHDLSMLVYDRTVDAGIYGDASNSWHYYFVARQTNCPVVLVECGYMSNPEDLAGMLDQQVLLEKAQAMATAVAEYFLNIG